MDAKSDTKPKKKRSPNFSMTEKNVLINEMGKVKDRIEGNAGKILTEEKMQIWSDLAKKSEHGWLLQAY